MEAKKNGMIMANLKKNVFMTMGPRFQPKHGIKMVKSLLISNIRIV